MKHLLRLFTAAALFCSINASAQQIKVLFLGNSFTYVYDVPGIFENLASEAGLNVFVDSYANPGIALGSWTGNAGHNLLSGSLNKINSQQWDYIIVQDNLGIWVGNSPYQEGYDDLVENLNNIKNNNTCTKVIYFAGWCPEGGVQSGDSESACASRLFSNFVDVNTNGGIEEIVSPVGLAWNSFQSQYPSVDLYYTDNTHASIDGAYLAASTIFVSTLKKDITNLSWYPTSWYDGSSMNATTALNMRQTAWNIVTNASNFSSTYLENNTPGISENAGVLSSTGYTSYQWYFNGAIINGATSASHTPAAVGMYMVVGVKVNGCEVISFEYEVTSISTVGLDENEQAVAISIYPNPVANQLNIIHSGNKLNSIEIIDLSGKVLFRNENSLQNINVDFLTKGIYLLRINLDGEMTTHKFIKK